MKYRVVVAIRGCGDEVEAAWLSDARHTIVCLTELSTILRQAGQEEEQQLVLAAQLPKYMLGQT